jgi:hypothetical protein
MLARAWSSARAARAGLLVIAVLALWLRARGLHRGLIYPDGYDYLLMARGIAAHLTPTLQLGHGGALFVPSVDAALKPLFPALVALLSGIWGGTRAAADAVTAVAGAATVVLASVLAARLTGSRAAGVVAAAAALASPALAYWSGFVGPDPMAEALALAAALAAVSRRPTTAGVLAALCALTRPEWLLVVAGVGVAGLSLPAWRGFAQRALVTAAFVLAAVLALLRPPIALPAGGLALFLGALAAGAALQLGAAWAARDRRRATVVAGAVLALILAAALSGRAPAARGLLNDEWPVLALAAFGLLWACWNGRGAAALALLGAAVVLGATYTYRNPGSERYLAQLLPLAAVAAGLTASRLSGAWIPRAVPRPGLGLAGALLVLAVLVAQPTPVPATDTFAAVAGSFARAPAGTLVSAAPDAYGFLLPERTQQPLRTGARGLILLDGAQRLYDPGVSARGAVIARFAAPYGFERPDGTIDTGPDVLVRGVVISVTTAERVRLTTG